MQAIDFVVRTGLGRVQRGQLEQADGQLVISANGNTDVSLNIGRDDVRAYSRKGNDLIIELDDGREIVIEGLFDGNGGQSTRLYFSEGGQIEEISFTESWGRTNHAHVNHADGVDGLVFDGSMQSARVTGSTGFEASGSTGYQTSASASAGMNTQTVTTWELNEGALLGGLLGVGALGLLGAAAGGGGGGGGGAAAALSEDIRITSVAGGTDNVVNASEMAASPSISGVTEPNTNVTVTVNGVPATTTSDANGNWTVTYNASDLPAGEYTATVVATATSSNGNTLTTSSTLNVDTVTTVGINHTTVEGDGVVLAAEAADGVNLTGNGEAGANVVITLNGVSQSTVVAADGTWTVNFSPASLDGINDQMVTVTADSTDVHGNIASSTQTIRVDTVIGVDFDNTQVGDNIINLAESQGPVTFTGTTEPGNQVVVDLNGVLNMATVSSNGTWTVDFQPSQLPAGSTAITLLATATDALGNSSTATHTVQMDTSGFVNISNATIEMDNIVNHVESQDGVVLTGTTLPGSSVIVDFGSYSGQASVDANGNWTFNVPASAIQSGEYIENVTATATSQTGNVSTDTSTVEIDTYVDPLTSAVVEGDDVISATEHADGVVVSGTVEAGSTVQVTMGGASGTAIVDGAGNWTYTFPSSSIPMGSYQTQLVVNATDGAGNVSSVTQQVQVDTTGPNVSVTPLSMGECDALNASEVANGVNVTGVSEANSAVSVMFNGVTHNTTSDASGNWTVFLSSSDLGSGTFMAPLVATATDAVGNSTQASTDLYIDTIVDAASVDLSAVATDGVVNGVEVGSVVVIGGMAEADSTVVVNVGGTDYTATVDPTGAWTADIPANSLAAGEYDTPVGVTVTDCNGNVATDSGMLSVDTFVNALSITSTSMDGQSVLNAYYAQTGVNLSGVVEPGSTVMVTLEGTTKAATVNPNGSWSVVFSGAEIPIGEYTTTADIVATDAAGNTASTTTDFTFDTSSPEAPQLVAITEGTGGWRSVALPYEDADWSVHSVSDDGSSASQVGLSEMHDTFRNELMLNFHSDVPDGTDLIIQAADDAGNQVSTLVIGEDNTQVDLTSAAYTNFDIEAIDLSFAQDSNLTITPQQLEDLSGLSNSLLVRGETGDSVTAVGAVATNQTEVHDGQVYDVYTLGTNGAYLVIDQEVDVIT